MSGDNFTAKIGIIIVGLDLTTGDRHILSTQEDTLCIPEQWVQKDRGMQDQAYTLCDQHIVLDPLWINPRCVSATNTAGHMQVLYAAMIPLDTDLIDAHFVDVSKVTLEEPILKALQHELVQ